MNCIVNVKSDYFTQRNLEGKEIQHEKLHSDKRTVNTILYAGVLLSAEKGTY